LGRGHDAVIHDYDDSREIGLGKDCDRELKGCVYAGETEKRYEDYDRARLI
jgi:hypothetical protein